jgi:hypothetical protein
MPRNDISLRIAGWPFNLSETGSTRLKAIVKSMAAFNAA